MDVCRSALYHCYKSLGRLKIGGADMLETHWMITRLVAISIPESCRIRRKLPTGCVTTTSPSKIHRMSTNQLIK